MSQDTSFQDTFARSLKEAFESFNQSISIVNPVTVKPPEFSGKKSQDIIEWVDSFEQTTLNYTDDQKKKLLGCAFTKAARAWFRDDLEPLLEGMAWPDIKKAILKRYKPDHQEHYAQQLDKLRYTTDSSDELASFVDQRVYISKKAYPSWSEKEIIRETIRAMAPTVKKELNLMKDTDEIDKISEFKSLVRRYDQKIKVNEGQQPSNLLNEATFQELLKKAVDGVVKSVNEKTEVLAATFKRQQAQQQVPDQNNNVPVHYVQMPIPVQYGPPVNYPYQATPHPKGGRSRNYYRQGHSSQNAQQQAQDQPQEQEKRTGPKKGALDDKGASPAKTHTIGCLNQKPETLIIEDMDVMGMKVKAIIDTGATASFVPLGGKIIKHIRPTLQSSNSRIETLGNMISSNVHQAQLIIKPWASTKKVTPSQVIVIDSGSHILGYDIVLGLPELDKLQAHISFKSLKPEIIWQMETNPEGKHEDVGPTEEEDSQVLALALMSPDSESSEDSSPDMDATEIASPDSNIQNTPSPDSNTINISSQASTENTINISSTDTSATNSNLFATAHQTSPASTAETTLTSTASVTLNTTSQDSLTPISTQETQASTTSNESRVRQVESIAQGPSVNELIKSYAHIFAKTLNGSTMFTKPAKLELC
ncbi:Hypothetical predicted protein [Olea europaea subsp. europaea]|uniref:Retrotransposon gag domain-containing protein n=1 Tax=Olea europaea subsp. europaea TaxID=158383 RepID=A0A8S0Q8X1_OLEEU|nr:Hypothetical predicted protein [Olea europaea subsp. europaea]